MSGAASPMPRKSWETGLSWQEVSSPGEEAGEAAASGAAVGGQGLPPRAHREAAESLMQVASSIACDEWIMASVKF